HVPEPHLRGASRCQRRTNGREGELLNPHAVTQQAPRPARDSVEAVTLRAIMARTTPTPHPAELLRRSPRPTVAQGEQVALALVMADHRLVRIEQREQRLRDAAGLQPVVALQAGQMIAMADDANMLAADVVG